MFVFLLALIASLPFLVAAHGGIWNYSIAGEWRPGFFPYYPAASQSSIQRHWSDFRPILNTTLPTLACNDPGTPAEEYATIPAGGEILAYYRGWPHDVGPIIVWMAYCGSEPTDCVGFDAAGGRHWFKIAQEGLSEGTVRAGTWAQKRLVGAEGNYTWPVTVPEGMKGGAYLIRHELIALHVPFTPEFYPECAHLFVTGSGEKVPGEEYLVSIPGVWKEDELELHLSIYEEPTSSRTEWTIPGPPVWSP
ncbi:lytic polysaccharide monooxygenase [Staphylotrichum tortipilum]|uniref:lytic cellulose monooxygenase (C4-dehydrogenating) n=1 Tax=Staphylotrichum tortipilum TaxID=2831512 RepID=A0AAN6MNZ7_9PEZI|nr:lytic polysaccharide monooxygenase [Staphylotrichum longicolle]